MKVFCLLLALTTSTTYAQTCASQNFVHSAPPNTWVGQINHSSGSHSDLYDFATSCNYTRGGNTSDTGTCDTDQSTAASQSDWNDAGSITGAPDAYHNLIFKSQQYQAHATQAGTAAQTVVAGTAVQACSHISGCAAVTITVPPFSATGGQVFETGDFAYNDGCPAKTYSPNPKPCTCRDCGCGSPLMVDIGETGSDVYELTNVRDGILFDLKSNGHPEKIAWTKPGSTFAVLVLPDDNGQIKNSRQLFGNYTPQPVIRNCGPSKQDVCPRNGFAALAVYDAPEKGGNGNGMIDKNDSIYYKLRLLLGKPNDHNHRLLSLQEANIESIDLNYQNTEQFEDTYGNLYKYESAVTTTQIAGNKFPTKRWMMDVWLMNETIGDKPGNPRDIRKLDEPK